MENENHLNNVNLTAEVEINDDSLLIKYNLENQSDEIIYVYDLLDIGDSIQEDLAYRCFEEPDTLRVVKAVLPLPLDRDVYMQEVPHIRSVDPNESIEGKINLPIPIMEYNPYYPLMNPDEQKETDINQIRLLIGWVNKRSGMKIAETNVGGTDVLQIRGSWREPHYYLAETIVRTETKLMVRHESFDRRMPIN